MSEEKAEKKKTANRKLPVRRPNGGDANANELPQPKDRGGVGWGGSVGTVRSPSGGWGGGGS